MANGIPAYLYYFTKGNRRLGAWHSGEEVYLYGNIPADSSLYTEEDRALSDLMRAYFRNFIMTGDPNGEGLPEWPGADGSRKIMEFGADAGIKTAPYAELYAILDEMYGID